MGLFDPDTMVHVIKVIDTTVTNILQRCLQDIVGGYAQYNHST